ncbi:hypothetical protein [Sphingobacterium siyangense]|uniref:hypothetical protein n=1 Tax=Sphingobacterium siyangense TaxID=459529 RepID=UPI003DA49F3B
MMKKLIKSIFGGRRKESMPQTKMGMLVERYQQRCADWLNQKSARLSVSTIVVLMSIFLMGGASFFVFVMFRSLTHFEAASPAIPADGRYTLPYGAGSAVVAPLSTAEIRLVEQYRSYMDSVSTKVFGKISPDSLGGDIKKYNSPIKKK